MTHVRNNILFTLVLAILGFFALQAIDTLVGVMNSPRVQVTCAGGNGAYEGGHLIIDANEGSNAFSVYTWEGDLVKVHAMPWEFGPNHDLWVVDCIQKIKEAAAAQQ